LGAQKLIVFVITVYFDRGFVGNPDPAVNLADLGPYQCKKYTISLKLGE